ncbi:YjbH domain-containing protein [Paracoccus sp. MC1862]|uniref:YjbH domain-containing protein n=1 Tax=Paracoccus sp. MC1862 TaxID=2760307 RepID=UPI001601094D|nr:YjbH domain-containing protein [Paracoccus sp. MC1862]MBB1498922.1 YjbH domain-containing protein [Paracoccus sp. MC1862]QQO46720.1 YjbH domain-containing protein [Paracoccus sp. MC1862]
MTKPRPSSLTRGLLATALPVAVMALVPAGAGFADPMIGTTLNRYGLPGAIDTPTAEMLPDATLSAVLGYAELGNAVGLGFQILPRASVVLRYGKFDSLRERRGYVRDRSFDFRLSLLDEAENGWRPALAVGIQDAIGTGFYGAEYIVATKTLSPRLRVSAGLGWGRLASDGGIGSPFSERGGVLDDEGGALQADRWFRGEVAPFANLQWQATDKLTLLAEYSGDDYACETGNADNCLAANWVSDEEPLKTNLNLGLSYQAGPNYQIGAYLLGGNQLALTASMTLNPRQAPYPSGLEKGPAPVRPRPAVAADPEGWAGTWTADPTAQPAIQKALGDALAKEGQTLESMVLTANRAEVRIRNNRYIQQAEAVGRTARLMTRALPPSVETLVVTSVEEGMPTSSVTMRRSDVERLENTEVSHIANAAVMTDAEPRPAGLVQSPGIAPRFQWSIRPSLSTGLFDPDEPLRYEVGATATATYEILPGLTLNGTLRQRLFGNADQDAPGALSVDDYLALSDEEIAEGNNGVYRVRSDGRMYSGNDKPRVPELTLNWNARPTETVYTRVTVGLLENMYGGVSGEALWKPVNSRLALGAEINRVRKRDYRDAFEFLDYEVTTGHVSAYYEFGGGFVGQLDVGRYLAGDDGATVTITREFASGWSVGAYATKTDLSSEEFGEGSFDKGITIRVPLSFALGTPSKRTVGGTISSLNRDGGRRVRVQDRLYDTVRDSHATKMYDGWGRFWR